MSKDNLKEFFEDGSGIKRASDELSSDTSDIYPFDCAPIDIVFGGGIYSGKIYEIFGWESQGKSTIGLESVMAFCDYWKTKGDDNYAVLWIESESALDKVRAQWMGCDLKRFLIYEAETIETGFKIITDTLVKCEKKGLKLLIIWDTIAAAKTEKEKEGGQYGGGMADKPRLLRHFLGNVTTSLGITNSTFIMVNQVYQLIGSYTGGCETPGGGGPKFHSSVRGQITKREEIVEINANGDEQSVGIRTELFTVKNKLCLPKQKALITIMGETGIDKLDTVVNYVKKNKLIDVKGAGWATIKHPDEPEGIKFQTTKKLREIIETKHPELYDYLNFLIYQHYCKVSPLIKVKIINKVWDYEKRFLGKIETTLTDKERELAKSIYDKLQDEDEQVKLQEEASTEIAKEEK